MPSGSRTSAVTLVRPPQWSHVSRSMAKVRRSNSTKGRYFERCVGGGGGLFAAGAQGGGRGSASDRGRGTTPARHVAAAASTPALGRKNYLFAGSHDAARRAAGLYSLTRTCAQYGVPPLPYFTDVLTKLGRGCTARAATLWPPGQTGRVPTMS
jgi:hypothetical protein